ncbi:hypothetical protein FOA52_004713 [Chlamydomonas sp. UWO 241]|nr:hypothetical protein FOA52_004713 [Chlamydomonas sp. UWO 241]
MHASRQARGSLGSAKSSSRGACFPAPCIPGRSAASIQQRSAAWLGGGAGSRHDDADDDCWWHELLASSGTESHPPAVPAPTNSSELSPDRDNVLPFGTTYKVWGLPAGPRGPHGYTLADWRAFRARMVALEAAGALMMGTSHLNASSSSPASPSPSSPSSASPSAFSPPSSASPSASSSPPLSSPPSSTRHGTWPGDCIGEQSAPWDLRDIDAHASVPPLPPPTAKQPAQQQQQAQHKDSGSRQAHTSSGSSSSSPTAASSSSGSTRSGRGRSQPPQQPQQQPQQQQVRRAGGGSSAECGAAAAAAAAAAAPVRGSNANKSGSSSGIRRQSHARSQPPPPPSPTPTRANNAVPGPRYSGHHTRASTRNNSTTATPVLTPGPGSWAHLLGHVEPGCLLLSRGGGPDMSFFDRTVVLVTSHDDAKGSVGFVLNKPSPMRVAELTLAASCPGFTDAFGMQRLQIGGPVHMDHITVLHRYMGLPGAREIGERLFTGGLPGAVSLVEAGLAKASDFHMMLGVSGWAPRQLAAEVSRGLWYVVAASPDLVLPKRAGGCAPSGDAALTRESGELWSRILSIVEGHTALPPWTQN